jgi:serine/threonine protein kinase/Tol biopolymer transport system component
LSELFARIQNTLGDGFTVERELGGGGMSHVFVAKELALGRHIVVKVLPPDAGGAVSIERFKREIKVAASLQHPHIVPLLAAGDAGGLPYYTMPYVKGESLRERLVKEGELPVKETLHILRDVAAGLAYAHAEGIVHRDIKPDNIILSGGVAVVTDFGVAKAVDAASMRDSEAQSGITSLGIALGTPAYMSPEQAAAEPRIDHRSDIYSFGCLAYEMLAGSTPFANRPLQQVLAAHIVEVPEPVGKRRPAVPMPLVLLVMKCLEKRPGDRPQDAGELLTALDAIATPSGGTEPTTVTSRRFRFGVAALAVGAVVVLIIAAVAWPLMGRSDRTSQPGRVTSVASTAALELNPAISPDGKLVAYVAGAPGSFRVLVRQINGERSVPVSQELGGGDHDHPSWSPDGSQIAFEANNGVYVVPSTGGVPKVLVDSTHGVVLSPAWSADGSLIAYADSRGIHTRAVSGLGGSGALSESTVADGNDLHSIAWSPDGRKIAYVKGNRAALNNRSAGPVLVVNIASRATSQVAPPEWINASPTWSADGSSLLYVSNREGPSDVYEQAIDRSGAPRGEPKRITTGLNAGTISLSANGTRLAYDVLRNRSNIWTLELSSAAVASTAAARRITAESQRIEAVSLSHDGKWLAFDSDRSGNFDIYKVAVDGGDPVRLTTNPGNDFGPSWAPDDRSLIFHSSRTGKREAFSVGVDGANERQLTHTPLELYSPNYSADGKQFVAAATDPTKPREQRAIASIFSLGSDGTWALSRRLATEAASWARWSRDGRWIAYIAPEGVRALFLGLGGSLRIVSAEGGESRLLFDGSRDEAVLWAAWGTDPNVVFFNTLDRQGRYRFYVMPESGGKPRLIVRDDDEHRVNRWDFGTDGRHIYFSLAADESDVFVMELKR